jgi:uncharacterized membrane protein YjjP (DUF1212 family)
MVALRPNKIIVLALLNAFLLGYLGWTKYFETGCRYCSQVTLLIGGTIIDGVIVAALGVAVSLLIVFLSLISKENQKVNLALISLAFITSGTAVLLQIYQYFSPQDYCYLCITAAGIFVAIYLLLVYENSVRQPKN